MIDRTHDLPVAQQCQIRRCRVRARTTGLKSQRSRPGADAPDRRTAPGISVCRQPDAARHAAAGRPRIGRKHVGTLMKRMGIEALYRKPNTSRRHPAHAVYPYLLRDMKINRPNQVWAADITYIPMKRGFVYLFAVMDWASRRVLSWRLSNTLTTDFCIEAVQEASQLRQTGHLQHRPGQPIHQPGIHAAAQG